MQRGQKVRWLRRPDVIGTVLWCEDDEGNRTENGRWVAWTEPGCFVVAQDLITELELVEG